jgi:hypothetical protein
VRAILVEVGAVAIWAPVFFITVEGPRAITADYSLLGGARIAGAVCIGASIAATVLLPLNRTKAWCTTRERVPA